MPNLHLPGVMDGKAELRKSLRATLRALSATAISSASELACARAATLVGPATAVCVYLAMPKGECDTTPLLDSLFAAGDKRVFVPRVEGDSRHEMRMLHVPAAADLKSYPRSKWGIPEPTDDQAATMEDGLASAAIDCVIVPGVAFDSRGLRMGQGKGFYDTWLTKLSEARAARGLPPARTIGLALSENFVERVPVDAHDVPLDYVCLPDRLVTREGLETASDGA